MSCSQQSLSSQRLKTCTSLPDATNLLDSDHFIACPNNGSSCLSKRSIGEAVEGGLDARLVRRGARFKWDVHDMAHYSEPDSTPAIEQIATISGVVAMTGTPQVPGFGNYDPIQGYVVPKKAFYEIHAHIQLNLKEIQNNESKDIVYAAIRKNGTAVITDVHQGIAENQMKKRSIVINHVNMFDVNDIVDVFVWLEDDVDVNTNVSFTLRSITIKQL